MAIALLLVTGTRAQSVPGVMLAPSRLEIEMKPGTERTLVIYANYTAASEGGAESFRMVASLSDWDLGPSGNVRFFNPGSQPHSACQWMIFSPAEMLAQPNHQHPIRVTIQVPSNTPKGEYRAAMFVEPRQDQIKLENKTKRLEVRWRLATIFYITVGDCDRRGSLENLEAKAMPAGIILTPTLKNEGNAHMRPTYSLRVVSENGAKEVLRLGPQESLPVLPGTTQEAPLLLEIKLEPGKYSVYYRVDFHDGSSPTEGETSLIVPASNIRPPISIAQKQ
jgi:hypothetical protein